MVISTQQVFMPKVILSRLLKHGLQLKNHNKTSKSIMKIMIDINDVMKDIPVSIKQNSCVYTKY